MSIAGNMPGNDYETTMKRRKVFATAPLSKESVRDCSVESDDSDRGGEPATVSPALLVGNIKFNGVTAGSRIELTVPVLPDVYLETITLIRGGLAGSLSGTLSKGTLERLGSAKATISAELYDFVLSNARTSHLLIVLEHVETRLTKIRFENV